MHRGDLSELHYIIPIVNLPSVQRFGILSHRLADKLEHESVALPGVQEKRATIMVPRGRPLHEYANLYINARNPMLYKRLPKHPEIVVLRVSPNVIDLPGVVVTDQNAASDWARYAAAPEGLAIVDADYTFAEYWTHSDQIEQWRHSSRMCAEVLVPDRLSRDFIVGAYAMSSDVAERVRSRETWLNVKSNPKLFFR